MRKAVVLFALLAFVGCARQLPASPAAKPASDHAGWPTSADLEAGATKILTILNTPRQTAAKWADVDVTKASEELKFIQAGYRASCDVMIAERFGKTEKEAQALIASRLAAPPIPDVSGSVVAELQDGKHTFGGILLVAFCGANRQAASQSSR